VGGGSCGSCGSARSARREMRACSSEREVGLSSFNRIRRTFPSGSHAGAPIVVTSSWSPQIPAGAACNSAGGAILAIASAASSVASTAAAAASARSVRERLPIASRCASVAAAPRYPLGGRSEGESGDGAGTSEFKSAADPEVSRYAGSRGGWAVTEAEGFVLEPRGSDRSAGALPLPVGGSDRCAGALPELNPLSFCAWGFQ